MDDQFDFFDTNAYSNDLVENKEVSVIKKEKTDFYRLSRSIEEKRNSGLA